MKFVLSLLALTFLSGLGRAAPVASEPLALGSRPAPASCAFGTLAVSGPEAPIVIAPMQNAPGPSPWSGSFYGEFRGGSFHFDAVVVNKLKDLHDLHGRLLGWELDGFAGTTLDADGKSVIGLGLTHTWKLFMEAYFLAGVGVSFSGGSPIGGGLLVGFGWHF